MPPVHKIQDQRRCDKIRKSRSCSFDHTANDQHRKRTCNRLHKDAGRSYSHSDDNAPVAADLPDDEGKRDNADSRDPAGGCIQISIRALSYIVEFHNESLHRDKFIVTEAFDQKQHDNSAKH